MPERLEPFTLRVEDATIADLRDRSARTRFPDAPPGEPWVYGTDLADMRVLVDYWRDGFDWRAQEDRLNAFPQYRTHLHGTELHFLHVPGQGASPYPLLLSHGWPGSAFEFLDLIPRLTEPARFGGAQSDAFTVIVPSPPGFGLSFSPGQSRLGIEGIADCFAALMTDVLGYRRFGVQGGDWGHGISARLVYSYSESVSGLHVNFLPVPRDALAPTSSGPDERRYTEEWNAWLKEEAGYQWIQGTKPQTLAFALTDSPAGLAAWIVEKFRSWSDCSGDVEAVFARDHLLANVSLHWFTGAIGSSFWPYYVRLHGKPPLPVGETIDTPMAYSEFPRELIRPPRSVAERVFTNIQRWTTMERGGHFAAVEQPDALAAEIRAAFRPLRQAS